MIGAVYAIILITLIPTITYCQLLKGDVCTHQSTQSQGVCKLINQCQQAREELVKFQRYPQMCGFQGSQPIVCCIVKENRKPGEISNNKCREYSNYTIEIIEDPTGIIGAPDIIKNECGHKVVTLILGGEPAGRKEFPHMASIGFEKTDGTVGWLCGGTIISENYILTAGHCLNSKHFGPAKFVRIGVTNLESNSIYQQEIRVAQRIAHPDYSPSSMYNDIALLKLENPARMNSYSRPACLYSNREMQAKKAIATGWGKTQRNGRSSDDLLKVTLDLVNQQSCNISYRYQISSQLNRGIVESQLCSGSINDEEKDTCQGDSGGPLQIYHTNDDIKCMYDIIGVTSFGKACGLDAGVYTRVSHFIKWIEDIVWPDTS